PPPPLPAMAREGALQPPPPLPPPPLHAPRPIRPVGDVAHLEIRQEGEQQVLHPLWRHWGKQDASEVKHITHEAGTIIHAALPPSPGTYRYRPSRLRASPSFCTPGGGRHGP